MLFSFSYSVTAGAQQSIEYATSEDNWLPFRYSKEGDSINRGIFPEMLTLLFERELGLKLNYKLRPWKRAQLEVKFGHTDFMLTIPTDQRRTYSEVTKVPFFQLYFNLYVYANHPKIEAIKKIKTIEDIKALDLLLVSTAGNGWHSANVEQKGVRTEIVKKDSYAARFVAAKRVDGMIDVALSMSPIIAELGLSNKIELTNIRFGPIDFHIMVSKKSPYVSLIPDIDQALQKLNDNDEFTDILTKYSVDSSKLIR